MKVKISQTELEEIIKDKIPSISEFNWGDHDGLELEVDISMDSIFSNNKIKPITIKMDKGMDKLIEREVAKATKVVPNTGRPMSVGKRIMNSVY